MVLRWRFIRACFWGIAVFFLFLAGISSDSLARSPLPFKLSAREGMLEAFPCQSCHQDLPPGSGEDEATSQEHSRVSVQHGGLRCLDCHDSENRDTLRTVDHRQISFSNMEEMCGCCHAAEYRDWKKGIHGKLVGFWNGIQWGLRCVECHDVHKPKPMTLRPEPPPHSPAAARHSQ